jgi:hypothetical protein
MQGPRFLTKSAEQAVTTVLSLSQVLSGFALFGMARVCDGLFKNYR